MIKKMYFLSLMLLLALPLLSQQEQPIECGQQENIITVDCEDSDCIIKITIYRKQASVSLYRYLNPTPEISFLYNSDCEIKEEFTVPAGIYRIDIGDFSGKESYTVSVPSQSASQ